jgi:hypothetical protein
MVEFVLSSEDWASFLQVIYESHRFRPAGNLRVTPVTTVRVSLIDNTSADQVQQYHSRQSGLAVLAESALNLSDDEEKQRFEIEHDRRMQAVGISKKTQGGEKRSRSSAGGISVGERSNKAEVDFANRQVIFESGRLRPAGDCRSGVTFV